MSRGRRRFSWDEPPDNRAGSVVLFQVHPDSILSVPFECDAPLAIDVNCVPNRLSAQEMKIETGYIHLFRPDSLIETRQTQSHTFREVRSEL
jgi:hypothetical protein